jgi:DNA-binding transcriptional LysR family regulator
MLDNRIFTFLTLYDEMNYRKTAEKLNMTQPGVTQHIQYLEKYYGVKLFNYNGRTLSKTANAEILKKHIDSIRAEENEISNEFTHKDSISLKIGATKTIGEFVIAPEILRFLSKRNHTLELHIDNTDILLSMLEDSRIDFAIIEGVFDKSHYKYHLMKKEKFFLWEEVEFIEGLHNYKEVIEKGLGAKIDFKEEKTEDFEMLYTWEIDCTGIK